MEMTFEPGATEHILSSFNCDTDEEGYIINEEGGERVENPEGEEVHIDNLAIIEEGSTIFVDDNFDSLVKYVERNR